MITVLSGGTGTPKLLQGIKKVVKEEKLNIIVNTLENNYFSGVYVSADIDTVLYTMADLINEETWYGRKDDTFYTHNELKKLGFYETLQIGDKDRALKIQKTMLMKEYSLTKSVKIQSESFGIKANIIPMSDQQSKVKIRTNKGIRTFHEYLINKQTQEQVLDVIYSQVEPTSEVLSTLENSDQIIIGPSNPITSINPIISMNNVSKILKKSYVTAVSPIIGENAISGPAASFMKAKGYEVNPVGVARIYNEFLNHYIINTTDDIYTNSLKEFIDKVSLTNKILKTLDDKIKLAKMILENK